MFGSHRMRKLLCPVPCSVMFLCGYLRAGADAGSCRMITLIVADWLGVITT